MEYVSPRFACDVVDNIVLGAHSKEDPTEEDWESYVAITRKVLDEYGSVKLLVYSLGGGPNSVQRSKANDVFKERPQHVAVMLNSAILRGVVTALSWFNPKVRAFNLEQLEEACRYLEISDAQLDQVREAFPLLKAEVCDDDVAASS